MTATRSQLIDLSGIATGVSVQADRPESVETPVDAPAPGRTPDRGRGYKALMAAAGLGCVALGAIGAVVPGLPTTVFLLIASWCFTRSCPWLERKLIRENKLFRPFLRYLEPGAEMPLKAKLIALAGMWLGVSASLFVFLGDEHPLWWPSVGTCAAALLGSWFVLRMGRGKNTRDGTHAGRPAVHEPVSQ
ncbi:MAG: YbaN family protein [Planctomycetota bacterium]